MSHRSAWPAKREKSLTPIAGTGGIRTGNIHSATRARLKRAESFVTEMAASEEARRSSRDAILEIVRPAGGIGMMRNLLTRSRAITTGVHTSWRVGQVAIEGAEKGEANACLILDADASVRWYASQPMAIFYRLAGIETYHIPDFEIVFSDGCIKLWEIQSDSRARQEDVLERTQLMARELPRLGYEYTVVTHRELCAEPRLGTARELWRYGHQAVDLRTRELVLNAIRRFGPISWGTILDGGLGPNGRDAVCRLTLEGVLHLDRSQPMSPRSCFSLAPATQESLR